MPDTFTEVTGTGLFGRLKNSLKGILIGIILILISFPALWFNEANSARSHAGLSQLDRETVSISADTVDSANDGKAVHLAGKAVTGDVLTDSRFKVSANAIRLTTAVEMYQWREKSGTQTEKNLGGGEETTTTYEYVREWSARPVDSSKFKDPGGHENPPMPYEGESLIAGNVSIGAFRLSDDLIRQIEGKQTLDLSPEQRSTLPEGLRASLKDDGPGYYQGADPASPGIGDLRIRFEITNPAIVSVIARQRGDTFENFVSGSGKEFSILKMGNLGKKTIIASERSQVKVLTLVFRFVGWLLMFLGFAALFKPLTVIADVVPLIGNIAAAGTGLIAALAAGALSLSTIAVAWIAYRPLVAIPLLAIAIGLIVFALFRVNRAGQAGSAAGT